MAWMQCRSCSAKFAVGLLRCPQCQAVSELFAAPEEVVEAEQEANVPKISVEGGPSNALGQPAEEPAADDAEDVQSPVEAPEPSGESAPAEEPAAEDADEAAPEAAVEPEPEPAAAPAPKKRAAKKTAATPESAASK